MIKPKYGSIENKKRNRDLLRKYPFLRPSPICVKSTSLRYKKYDYSFTRADFIYPGFMKAFGSDLFDELRNKLLETNDLHNFRLLFYEGDPFHRYEFLVNFFKDFNGDKKTIIDILKKYVNIAKNICPRCGNNKTGELEELCYNCRIETGKTKYDYTMNQNLEYIELNDGYWAKPIRYIYQNINNSKSENKKLIKEFPFLMPCKKTVDNQLGLNRKYDYSFTILDFIKSVYLNKFVFDILYELKNELIKNGDLYNCSLNIDGNFYVDDTYLKMIYYKKFNGDKKQINNILKKYLDLKKVTCPECGNLKNENDKICNKCKRKEDRKKLQNKLLNKINIFKRKDL